MNDVYLCKVLGKFLEAGLSDFLLPLEHKRADSFQSAEDYSGLSAAEELKGIQGR